MPPLRPVAVVAALLCSMEARASAQTLPSLDVRTWRPSTDPSANLVLEPVATPGPFAWNVAAWANYTSQPVAVSESGATGVFRPIQSLLAADLVANVGLGSRAAIGIDLPTFLYQEGSGGLPSSVSSSSRVPASGLGDLAVTGKATILRNDQGGFGLAALGAVTVPTGDRESFMGEGATTVGARLLADYSVVVFDLQASLGYTLLTDHRTWLGLQFGDQLPWSIGLLAHPSIFPHLDPADRQTWEIAFHGSLPAGPVGPFGTGDPGSQALSPALMSISDRIALGHFRDTFLLIGGEIGLTSAIGVPAARAIVAVGWAPRTHDKDHDGVPDDVDQCPGIPEDVDGFEDSDGCPEVDNDEDGIPDRFDACPGIKGVHDPDPKKNGCPRSIDLVSDRDHDDIPDPMDRCPDQPEDRDGFEDNDGCPDPDNDRDGVADMEDSCPTVAGEASHDPRRNGCPNLDHDGDTFDDAVDACPGEPEVFNGIKDGDGCPDVGGAPLATVDTTDPRLPVRLRFPLRFTNEPALGVDPQGATSLRAIAQILNRHSDWSLAVGVRPGDSLPPADAMKRGSWIAAELGRLTHRPAAEAVAWSAVAKQPGGESGVGFLVLVGKLGPVAPLRLHPEASPP